ncbi:MAG: hypothetical protein ACYTGC_09725, partial [Planctomycetota bacterium]
MTDAVKPDATLESQAGATPTPLRPVGERERIYALDVLRGMAILGIFFVNMQFFAMPLMDAIAIGRPVAGPPSEEAAWAFVKIFCEYKFISMFSLLFGMGLVVQMTRAEAAGRSFVP